MAPDELVLNSKRICPFRKETDIKAVSIQYCHYQFVANSGVPTFIVYIHIYGIDCSRRAR